MKYLSFIAAVSVLLVSCSVSSKQQEKREDMSCWVSNSVIYEVNIRQYTPEGTFNAFVEHLPRLKELGVDLLWIMPIHPISEKNKKGILGSYYAVADYKGVNPAFGTESDFKALVDKAHGMGMRVIIDWVANHTGCDNRWTIEHPEYYTKDSVGGFVSPYDWTDTYDLDYSNADMRKAMIDAMAYWVREYDVDGFRCDVAYEVPTDFWNAARETLDSIKPVFMLAEAEHPDLNETAFDMSYNWPLKNLMADIAAGKSASAVASLDSLFSLQQTKFPDSTILMNHITNHDLNSWEGTEFDRLKEGVKAFAVLMYTVPGMPLLYTAQETGLNRAIQFFEKDPVGSWDKNEWFDFYASLNRVKSNNAALSAFGKWSDVKRYDIGNKDVIAYERTAGNQGVIVVLNLSGEEATIEWKERPQVDGYSNLFDKTTGVLPETIEAWGYRVLVR